MKVLDLAYTKKIGIKESTEKAYLLQLDFSPQNTNHLGTVHASASYSLAEITSGFFLKTSFAEVANQTIPVLRSSNIKYKKGASGILFSTAKLVEATVSEVNQVLVSKKKVLVMIQVKLFNEDKELILSATFEWFVILKPSS